MSKDGKEKQEKATEESDQLKGLCAGRNVHLFEENKQQKKLEERAATVAYVLDSKAGRCNLSALDKEGNARPVHDVPFSAEPKAGCWSWPERK